ncbi:amidase [Planococcus sp. CAU13]|uniref:amidase n=1 Tax=Planococcus sp. CAU13 TaxID=1541197 RepID=UPI00052FF2A9|nr:amidase [Planococcus sp. CAU13]
MTDLGFLSASHLAPLIQKKQLSPVELTKHLLKRIDVANPTLNAFITPLHEVALKQAKQAEQQIVNGHYKGPLHGIPIGIKDNYETEGIRTTGGSKIFFHYVPPKNAVSVDKLLAAGGIMLGKMNMNELGAGSSGHNPVFGVTRNPWNHDYLPGGSSSGSAAALAAGLAPLTTGTDTFGSNRIPAAMSGVYGLKPTYGLISSRGVLPSAWSLDHPGPITRSSADLALMLNYMAGFDPHDPPSLRASVTDYTAALTQEMNGMKIGIPTYYLEGLDPDIEKLFQNARSTLKKLGAEIKEIEIPELAMATFAGLAITASEAAAYNFETLLTQSDDYGQDVRSILSSGTLTSAVQYLEAQQARRALTRAFHKAFEEVDLLLGPTIPIATPKISRKWVKQNLDLIMGTLPFTVPANLTGIPALSVPMGLDSNGLPAGMQFMGRHLSEQLLLQAGSAWETTQPLRYNRV